MSASTTAAPGWEPWRTFRTWWGLDEGIAVPSRHDLTLSHIVSVPAQGEAFAFDVEIFQSWSVTGGSMSSWRGERLSFLWMHAGGSVAWRWRCHAGSHRTRRSRSKRR